MLKKAFEPLRLPGGAPANTAGLMHFMREHDGRPVRYHLRIEPDGSGLLLANASAAVRLSPTGVAIAHGLLAGESDRALARGVVERFAGAPIERVRQDIIDVRTLLGELARPLRGAYPLRSLDEPEATVHRRVLRAPLSADVTVDDDLESSLGIVQRLWEAGVPQVMLSLSPDAQADGLVRIVERAEDLGLIAGVRVRATDLVADGLLDDLARVGLDHLDVLYAGEQHHDTLFGSTGASDYAAARAALERALQLEICPVAVVPIVATTFDQLESIADELASLRVRVAIAFALVSTDDDPEVLSPDEVRQAAATIEEVADHRDLDVVWAPPLERDASIDVIAQVRQGPRTAGEASMRVRSDGTVLAPEGPSTAAGNLLRDPWPDIWSHASFRRYREAVDDPSRCASCPGLALCAAGCPARPETWARVSAGDPR